MYWSFGFTISPPNDYSGPISFRMDWLDLLAVQGTLKSLIQHHSSKASILRCSAFFIVQLSHPYMTTGKSIALTRRTFVGKVMSLLINSLSILFMTFLPRSKELSFTLGINNILLPGGSVGKASACSVGDQSAIPGSGRSPGGRSGNPFQYSCLEDPIDGAAWQGTVHGVPKSQTGLSKFTFTLLFY